MRYSSFPPKLREFVDSVEQNAEAAGKSKSLARIFGAWSACFVRFCTVNDYSWRDPDHVSAFLQYLDNRDDIDARSRQRAAESMTFLFERLLKVDLGRPAWHPDRRAAEAKQADASSSDTEEATDEGEQSTLLTRLLFHTSLPINEALELCAGDVDLEAGLIYVSDPMGTPKQIVELPDTLREPFRQHLNRLRNEHGARYFDAPLFQARALQGRKDDASSAESDSASESSSPDELEESAPSERPASLWGYAEES